MKKINYLFVIGLGALTFTTSCKKTKTSTSTTTTGSTKPVLEFKFDGGTTKNTGTSSLAFAANGGFGYGADRNGNANSAGSFDGVDDYISVTHGADINFDNVTITAWIKPTDFKSYTNGSTTTDVYSGFVGKCPNYNVPTFPGFTTSANSGLFRVSCELNSTTRCDCSSSTGFSLNVWVHVAYVINNGTLRVYRNGVLEKEVVYSSSTLMKNTSPLTIGRVSWFPGDTELISYFTGLLDDVRVYNIGLNSSQVLSIYNGSM